MTSLITNNYFSESWTNVEHCVGLFTIIQDHQPFFRIVRRHIQENELAEHIYEASKFVEHNVKLCKQSYVLVMRHAVPHRTRQIPPTPVYDLSLYLMVCQFVLKARVLPLPPGPTLSRARPHPPARLYQTPPQTQRDFVKRPSPTFKRPPPPKPWRDFIKKLNTTSHDMTHISYTIQHVNPNKQQHEAYTSAGRSELQRTPFSTKPRIHTCVPFGPPASQCGKQHSNLSWAKTNMSMQITQHKCMSICRRVPLACNSNSGTSVAKKLWTISKTSMIQ